MGRYTLARRTVCQKRLGGDPSRPRNQERAGPFSVSLRNDTGSPEVQIAVYSSRIAELTEHLKGHNKDHAGRRGLLMLVSRRRRLLKYLESSERSRYTDIIARLGLRK